MRKARMTDPNHPVIFRGSGDFSPGHFTPTFYTHRGVHTHVGEPAFLIQCHIKEKALPVCPGFLISSIKAMAACFKWWSTPVMQGKSSSSSCSSSSLLNELSLWVGSRSRPQGLLSYLCLFHGPKVPVKFWCGALVSCPSLGCHLLGMCQSSVSSRYIYCYDRALNKVMSPSQCLGVGGGGAGIELCHVYAESNINMPWPGCLRLAWCQQFSEVKQGQPWLRFGWETIEEIQR